MPGKMLKVTDEPEVPQIGGSGLEPEYKEHVDAFLANPTLRTGGNVLRAVKPIMESALRTYGGGQPSPTLRSKAKVMTLEGVSRYDPNRGVKLRTWLMTHLKGLQRAGVQESQSVHIPERILLDQGRMRTGEADLRDRLGREPSSQELADHVGLSIKRIAKIRQAQPGYAESSLVTNTEDGGQEQASPAVVSHSGEDSWREFIYHDLGPVDQAIMEHSLGLHGRPAIQKREIAQKLGLSTGAISQRAAKIQEILDKRETLGGSFFQ